MEIVIFIINISLLLLSTLFVFIRHFFINKHKQKSGGNNLPPGSTGWPLIGETLSYGWRVWMGTPEKFAREGRDKHASSKVFHTSLLGEKVAILGGAEGNKFLFSGANKSVQWWLPKHIRKIFPPSPDHNTDYRNTVMILRKMITSFAKSDSFPKFVAATDTVMKHNLLTDWAHKETITVWTVAKNYTFSVAFRLFFSIDDDTDKVERLAKLVEETSLGIVCMPINILPWSRFNRALKASRAARQELTGMVKQRKMMVCRRSSSDEVQDDVMSQMLIATDENGKFLKEDDIANYLQALLQGGCETISSCLTFLIKYLADHPDVYDQVLREQMEIARSKESNELLNPTDLRNMKYSSNVLKEVLRLTPPALGAFREAITDCTYAGYTIPKGWKLHWIIQDTHKNPEYFPNPEKFDPSRYEGEGPPAHTYVPFGGGALMCPGIEYTKMVVLVFIHNVVTKFRWEKLIPNEKVAHLPFPMPSQGLPIRLHPHNSIN